MPLWKKLWLLFSLIWVGVAALNVFTILAFGDNPAGSWLRPLLLMLGVPAAAYTVGWIAERVGRRRGDRAAAGEK
jgi:hypothetical protein